MPKTVVITQSNYLPWKGYFDLLMRADMFILLDCVQYTRRDWRNRNRIKTPAGLRWISIPVAVKGRFSQAIDETRIASTDWAENHIALVERNYRNAPEFSNEGSWLFATLREAAGNTMLSKVNRLLLESLANRIGIHTPIISCDEVLPRTDLQAMDPTDRLVALSRSVGATTYLSGPAAQNYLDAPMFEKCGIAVEWMDYSGYPPYPQQWGPFDHAVSIIDLLLNVGHSAAAPHISCDRAVSDNSE